MTEINISRERVEKLAKRIERALSEGGKGSAGNPEDVVASTLRALRTALDEAEAERDRLKRTLDLHAGDVCSLNNEVDLMVDKMTDIEQKAREVAERFFIPGKYCDALAKAILTFHRDSLTVPDEVEKLCERLRAASASLDRPPSVQSMSNLRIIEACDDAATLIRRQAARIAEMEAETKTREKINTIQSAALRRYAPCGGHAGKDHGGCLACQLERANFRATSLAAQVEAMRGALEWYANEDGANGHRFYIVDEKGERIERFSEIGERARTALAALKENPDADH